MDVEMLESAFDGAKQTPGGVLFISATSSTSKKRKLTPEERAARDAEKEKKRIAREKEKADREEKKALAAAEKEKRRIEREKQAEMKKQQQEEQKLAREAKAAEREAKATEREAAKKLKEEQKAAEKREKELALEKERLAKQQREQKINSIWLKVGVLPASAPKPSGPTTTASEKVKAENGSKEDPVVLIEEEKKVSFDQLFPPLQAGLHIEVAPPLFSSDSDSPQTIDEAIAKADWDRKRGLEWLKSRKGKRVSSVVPREMRRKAMLLEQDEELPVEPRFKLFQFHACNRPAYFGTWRKKSNHVKPRRPFGKDDDLVDYDFDSDDEWEEEEPGEDLEAMEDNDNDNDEEGDDIEDDDPFVVPDGYLSEGEVPNDDDEIAGKNVLGKNTVPVETKKSESAGYQRLVPIVVGPVNNVESVLASVNKLDSSVPELPVELRKIGFSNENRHTWAAGKAALEVLVRCRVVPLVTDPVSEYYEGDCEDEGIDNGDGREGKGVLPRPVPDNLVEDLAKLVHGSILGREKLVKSFHSDHPEIPKSQIEKKILEIAKKERNSSDYCARWRVVPDVAQQFDLPAEFAPLPPPDIPKTLMEPLVKFVHGSLLARDRLVKDFYVNYVKGKGEEVEVPKTQIERKILEIAVKDKRDPTPTIKRWYVNVHVLESLGLPLEVSELTESELGKFPSGLLPDLVKFVHGSLLAKDRLIREFHENYVKGKGEEVEVPKTQIERKILEIAVKDKREPTKYVSRWYVHGEVLSSVGMSPSELPPVPTITASTIRVTPSPPIIQHVENEATKKAVAVDWLSFAQKESPARQKPSAFGISTLDQLFGKTSSNSNQ